MQAKYGQAGIYINRPRKMRNYLIEKCPDNLQYRENKRIALHHSLDKNRIAQPNLKKEFKSSFAELIMSTRKKTQPQRSKHAQRALNLSINIRKLQKQSLKLDEVKVNNQKPHKNRQKLQILDEQDGKYPKAKRHLRVDRHLVIPFISAEKKKHQTLDFSTDNNEKETKMSPQNKKVSQQVHHFKPKHRSLHKMSAQLIASCQGAVKQPNFIEGFLKQKKLGKGGFSVVWQARDLQTGKMYAIKEIDTFNQHQTHLAQITFGSFFFEKGIPKAKFKDHAGINVLLAMHNYHVCGQKIYIVYEKCTASLGQFLFDIYQQTKEKELADELKTYIIVHKRLYQEMRRTCRFLKILIFQIAQALDLLNACNIVHSDVKTSNILMNLKENKHQYSFKLIDYGSSFFFQDLHQYRLATPEYMPPQMLNFLNQQRGRPYNKEMLAYTSQYENISAIDMWGLGCIVLEIIHGIPLWLNSKVKVKISETFVTKHGCFASDHRSYSEIMQKQLELIKNLDSFLLQQNNTQIFLDNKLKTILKRLLEVNPLERIRPSEVIDMLASDCL